MKKLRLYNGNIQRIVVKMAEMYGTGYLFRRKVTKLKRNQNMCNIIENAKKKKKNFKQKLLILVEISV